MNRTKFEKEYFELAESFDFRLDPNTGIFYFDEFDLKLAQLRPKFEAEILENSTLLEGQNRELYYDRIKRRAILMGCDIRFVETKPDQWKYTYEGDLIIDPPFEEKQYIEFDKFGVMIENEEYPLTAKGVEARKEILIKHKNSLIQQINRYFPDLYFPNRTPEPEQPEPIEIQTDNSIRNKIKTAFSFMLQSDPRKHKQILTEQDFEKLISWLTHYSENEFSIPEITEPIITANTTKGNIIYSFKAFFQTEFRGHNMPDSLFELAKSCFYQLSNDKIENMRKTKEPENYKDLIKQRK